MSEDLLRRISDDIEATIANVEAGERSMDHDPVDLASVQAALRTARHRLNEMRVYVNEAMSAPADPREAAGRQ